MENTAHLDSLSIWAAQSTHAKWQHLFHELENVIFQFMGEEQQPCLCSLFCGGGPMSSRPFPTPHVRRLPDCENSLGIFPTAIKYNDIIVGYIMYH